MTTTDLMTPTAAVDGMLAMLGDLFTTADDATALTLLEATEGADSRVTALERRRTFRVIRGVREAVA